MVSDARRERFNQLDWSLDLLMIGALLELKSLVASAKWVHFWNMRKLKHIFLWKVILPSFSFWTLFGEVTFSCEERGLSTGSRFIEEMKGRSDFCFTEWLLGAKQRVYSRHVARVDIILPTVEIHSADAITDFLALDVGALMRVRVLKRNGERRRFSWSRELFHWLR